jgi:hypothetical protein
MVKFSGFNIHQKFSLFFQFPSLKRFYLFGKISKKDGKKL